MRYLLRAMPEGHPDDYLLARIRGRRAFLVADWERLLLAPVPMAALPAAPWRTWLPTDGSDQPWRALQREYTRVFAAMEERLRRLFIPFFWMAELRTVAICLRERDGGREADVDLLRDSLMASPLKAALRNASGVGGAVEALAAFLASGNRAFERLPQTFRDRGTGALEADLNDISLEWFAGSSNHPHMARFLGLLIDGRNLEALVKQLHWRMPALPHLIAGGTISLRTLERLFKSGDAEGLARLTARVGGDVTGNRPEAVLKAVTSGEGKILRRMGRDPEGIGTILDYLWRCGLEAHNVGLLSCLPVAGIDSVASEILQ